jgi:hypothetical protein
MKLCFFNRKHEKIVIEYDSNNNELRVDGSENNVNYLEFLGEGKYKYNNLCDFEYEDLIFEINEIETFAGIEEYEIEKYEDLLDEIYDKVRI